MNWIKETEIRKEMVCFSRVPHCLSSLTVEENIMFPVGHVYQLDPKKKLERVNEVLNRVNLEGTNKKFPAELSGGMIKRVGIARAIVLNPKYLFVMNLIQGLILKLPG